MVTEMERVEFLQIEPTTRCNFTCGFCCGRHMPQADMDFSTFEAAVSKLPALKYVHIQGEGEPLMHPRFFDMVELAKSRGAEVAFVTNGSYFTPDNVERILAADVRKIMVSIESPDPVAFREIRGGKLEKVIDGIDRLIKARNARGLTFPAVGFAVTVMNRTRDEWKQIVALYKRLGMDGFFELQGLQEMEAYTKYYSDELRKEFISNEDAVGIRDRAIADPEVIELYKKMNPQGSFYDELMSGSNGGTCPWLHKALYLSYDGNMTGCCMIKDTAHHGFGVIQKDSLEQILERRAQLADALRRGETPEPCAGCTVADRVTGRRSSPKQLPVVR